MTNSFLDRLATAIKVVRGTVQFSDDIRPDGVWDVVVTRADGRVERKTLHNVVTDAGLNRIANRAIGGTGSAWAYLGVGTVTAAASLDSVNFGEVANGRKLAATVTQSREWFALTMTWAGNADSLTGIALDSAAILCHASSGQGSVCNIVNSLQTTLAASDFLLLTARVRIGSHDLDHTT